MQVGRGGDKFISRMRDSGDLEPVVDPSVDRGSSCHREQGGFFIHSLTSLACNYCRLSSSLLGTGDSQDQRRNSGETPSLVKETDILILYHESVAHFLTFLTVL